MAISQSSHTCLPLWVHANGIWTLGWSSDIIAMQRNSSKFGWTSEWLTAKLFIYNTRYFFSFRPHRRFWICILPQSNAFKLVIMFIHWTALLSAPSFANAALGFASTEWWQEQVSIETSDTSIGPEAFAKRTYFYVGGSYQNLTGVSNILGLVDCDNVLTYTTGLIHGWSDVCWEACPKNSEPTISLGFYSWRWPNRNGTWYALKPRIWH